MDGCIENGRDMTECGAKYNLFCVIVTGLSGLVDSLAVVKKLVFEEKVVTLEELRDAITTNYEGREALQPNGAE